MNKAVTEDGWTDVMLHTFVFILDHDLSYMSVGEISIQKTAADLEVTVKSYLG